LAPVTRTSGAREPSTFATDRLALAQCELHDARDTGAPSRSRSGVRFWMTGADAVGSCGARADVGADAGAATDAAATGADARADDQRL